LAQTVYRRSALEQKQDEAQDLSRNIQPESLLCSFRIFRELQARNVLEILPAQIRTPAGSSYDINHTGNINFTKIAPKPDSGVWNVRDIVFTGGVPVGIVVNTSGFGSWKFGESAASYLEKR